MIVAVVVTYSAPASVLDACLDSLDRAGGVDHIIVVDSGGTANLRRVPDSVVGVELIRIPNRGYGAAANVGFARAAALGATSVSLLNDDIVVHDGWIEPLVAEMTTERVGAAQPKLLVAGAEPPIINSLGVSIGLDGAGTDIGFGEIDRSGGDSSPLDIFTGGAVVFAPDFLADTGGFDERYFLYYEDVDLARRGRSLGWRYRLVPTSVVEHIGGVSTGGEPATTRYYQERNRLWVSFRHAGWSTIWRATWLSIRRLRHHPRAVHRRALLAGIVGAPKLLTERFRGADQRP